MSETFIFPIPIRDRVVVRVQMPTDITRKEAEKVVRAVTALVDLQNSTKT